jgi:hypothetical protein
MGWGSLPLGEDLTTRPAGRRCMQLPGLDRVATVHRLRVDHALLLQIDPLSRPRP